MDVASQFLLRKKLLPRWMFRRKIRVAINDVVAEDFLECEWTLLLFRGKGFNIARV